MQVQFILDDLEKEVTPLKTADAIINSDQFDINDLRELIAHISIYVKYKHK